MNYVEVLEKKGITTYGGAGEDHVLFNCLFHDDQTPSCEVNINTGQFYCFGCGKKGGFAKLLAEIEGISVEDAKKQLLEVDEIADVVAEINRVLEGEEEKEEIKYFSVKSFHKVFPKVVGTPGEEYLKGKTRKINLETAEKFDLRWGIEGVMKDRVVIPVYTTKGKLLTYAGRTIHEDVQPKTRKVRSGLTTLYGFYEIVQQWNKPGKLPYLIVVEGEFDAMYLQQLGYWAVSTMGTAKLTEDQVALLKRHSQMAVWSYDADNAGRRAQKEAVNLMRQLMPCVSVVLPEGRDPNDLSVDEAKKIYRRFYE